MALTPSQQTGFLDLPLEIRLDIYAYLFTMPAFSRRKTPDAARVHAAILGANRQINREATHLLYGANVFLAHPSLLAAFPRLRPWCDPVRHAAVVPRIRRFHVDVRLDCDLPYDEAAVTRAFSGLDELSVEVQQAMFLGVGYENLRKFEGVRGVRRVHIQGSTTGFEDYIAWLEHAMTSPVDAKIDDFVPSESGWASLLTKIHR